MRFTKMQAFGNDYVYIDAIHQKLKNLPELARFVSDRHFAIGSDGMVLICPSEGTCVCGCSTRMARRGKCAATLCAASENMYTITG